MLLVHPVHEVLRQLPLLVGAVVVGSTTGNPYWMLAALALTVTVGAARWFTTTYRIDGDAESGHLQLRTGLLQRNVLSLPRNRIRSVATEARPLHRLLGLTVLRVGTGQEAKGDNVFELNAVETDLVPRLRAVLLAAAPGQAAPATGTERDVVLARWQPSWLRYAPLSFSGLVTLLAAAGVVYQTGLGHALQSWLRSAGLDVVERVGVPTAVSALAAAGLIASVLLAVGRSLLTYGNLVLARRGDVLHLRHGLLRVRERSYDTARLRGGTLREPLLVRALGGARLDAVMTGVNGAGESSLLLPPCPAGTAEAVLTGLVGEQSLVAGRLTGHGPAAARRRWARALAVPLATGGVLAVVEVPGWVWPVWALAMLGAVVLAADRRQALGHRVSADWLVARTGSLQRRRDCIATAGIIAWTVRQSWFQRRAGVATLVAATAAGVKAYRVIDVPVAQAWAVAAQASPWVAESAWAR
jgi:putative membrane protein